MRRMIWAASVAALLAVSAAPLTASAETEAAPKAKAKAKAEASAKPVRLYGDMAIIAKEIQLTPEQKAQLEVLAKERNEVIGQWAAQNKDRYAKAKADSESTDEATKKAGTEDMAKYRKESTEAQAAFNNRALALLTPEQRAEFEGVKLAASVERTYTRRKIELTDDQKAKIRELSITQTKTLNPADTKAARAAYMSVSKEVTTNVLTEEQRGQMMSTPAKTMEKPAAKPMEKPAAKPKAKKAAPADDEGGNEDNM